MMDVERRRVRRVPSRIDMESESASLEDLLAQIAENEARAVIADLENSVRQAPRNKATSS